MKFKKALAGVLCFAVLGSNIQLATREKILFASATETSLLGDVNGDRCIDSRDAVLILKDYANILAGKAGDIDVSVEDVNNDGNINSKDAVIILQYYANSIVENINGNAYYLDQLPIIESDCYTGNMGDSFVYPIGKHKKSRGNTSVDGRSYNHGIEGWVARWNYKNELSWAYSIFKLDGKYSRISRECKLIKSYNTDNFDTTLEFLDGNNVIQKYHLTPDSMPVNIDLDVSGCENLKIYFYDNVAKSGGTSFGLVEMKLE